MKIWLEEDREHGCWVVHHRGVRLRTPADVAEFGRRMREAMAVLGNQRAFLLVDMEDFELEPALTDAYGGVVRVILREHVRDIFRFAPRDALDATSVRLAAIRHHFESNIFPSRAAALEALAARRALEV